MVVSLAAALMASLLALAFLLGRASAPGGPPATTGGPARTSSGQVAPAATPATEVPGAAPPSHQVPWAMPAATPAGAADAPVQLPAAPAAQEDAGAVAPVAAYFARLERIQGAAGGGPSQEVAQRILGALLQGDDSAFTALIDQTERAEREVQGIVPPPECATYHQALLASLAAGRAVLAELRAALAAEDANRVLALAGQAASLQEQAAALEAEERELRSRFGLPVRSP